MEILMVCFVACSGIWWVVRQGQPNVAKIMRKKNEKCYYRINYCVEIVTEKNETNRLLGKYLNP